MDNKTSIKAKAKRHKKRKSRTQASDSDRDSDSDKVQKQRKVDETQIQTWEATPPKNASKSQKMVEGTSLLTEDEVSTAFTGYYMQKATTEFSDDLDRIRGSDDFQDDALSLLIQALQQGTSIFSVEDQRRVCFRESG